MADTINKVIHIDVTQANSALKDVKENVESTGQSFSSMKEYKQYIDKLTASLVDLDKDSEEYAKTCKDIQSAQDKLNTVMADAKKVTDAADGSYNALSKQMAELKKQWKATADEAQRTDIGKKINSINDQLKNMDASIGNYQRNVGNYAGGFTKAIEGIGSKVAGLANPMALAKKGVIALNGAFKILIANPIGAVIAAIVLAIKGIVDGFKSSEVATQSLQRAFAAFEPIINAVKNAFAYLAEGIGLAIEYASKFINFIGSSVSNSYAQAVEESEALIKLEQELVAKQREFAVEEAKTERDVSELRNKAAQKDKYTAEERRKFVEEAVKLEKELGDKRLEIAQKQNDIDKRRAAQAPNDAAANDKLAQSEANLYNVEKDVANKTRELNAQLAELNNTTNAAAKSAENAAQKKAEDLRKAVEKAEEFASNINLDTKIEGGTEIEMPDFSEAIDNMNKYVEALKTVKEAENATSYESKYLNDLAQLNVYYEEKKRLLEQYGLDTTALTEQYELQKLSIEQSYAEQSNKIQETRMEVASKAVSHIAAGLGAITNAMKSNLDMQLKTGKMSEKEYEERKKVLDNFEIATIITNAAVASFDIWRGYIKERAGNATIPEPATRTALNALSLVSAITNQVITVATAASQIAAIKSGTLSSTSISAGTDKAAPVVQAYTPSYTQNVTTASDESRLQENISEGVSTVKVYVTDKDITETHNKVQVRDSEATF